MPKSTMNPNPIWNHVYTFDIMTLAYLVLSDQWQDKMGW